MKTSLYLVMNRKGGCRTVKGPPHLARDEIAIGLKLTIPDSAFLAPVVHVAIEVPESAIITPQIEVEVEMPQAESAPQ